MSGSDLDADKVAYGFDAYAQLALPILIHPYVRGGIAIKEELDVEGTKIDDNFSSYHYGIGVSLTVFPMIQLFAEYMRYESTIDDDSYPNEVDMSGNAFHVGAKISI